MNQKQYDYLVENCIKLSAEEAFALIKKALPDCWLEKGSCYRISCKVGDEVFGIDLPSRIPIGEVGRIATTLIHRAEYAKPQKVA